jgi:hypothetical protein
MYDYPAPTITPHQDIWVDQEPDTGKNCDEAAPYDVPNGSASVKIIAH